MSVILIMVAVIRTATISQEHTTALVMLAIHSAQTCIVASVSLLHNIA